MRNCIVLAFCAIGLAIGCEELCSNTPAKDGDKKPAAEAKDAAFKKAMALGVDYFVARLARDRKKIIEDDWQIVGQLERRLKAEGRAIGAEMHNLDFKKLKRVNVNKFDNGENALEDHCLVADSIKSAIIGDSAVGSRSRPTVRAGRAEVVRWPDQAIL